MKHFYLLITALLTINVAMAQTYTIADVTLNGQAFKKITGTINNNETLNSSFLWIIADSVKVAPSTKLTITPGTQIFAENVGTVLYVNPLGEVDWQGTATAPIVFNSLANAPGQGSGNDAPGQWNSIRIDGNGPGSNAGTIRYVRQMYAGGDNAAVNAFQLENVGNGTTVEYIQVYRNTNRGFRINNGDVNVKYLVSTDGTDVGIRFDSSYTGTGQFLIVNKDIAASNAIECRVGNALLSNITITGAGLNVTGGSPVGGGIRVRSDGTAQIYNTVVTGVDTSLRFDSTTSSSGSVFRNSAVFGNNINAGTGVHSSGAVFNPSAGTYNTANNNTVTPFTITDSYVGTSTLNSIPAGPLSAFFTNVNYVGAVESGAGNDWTVGWTLNLDGTVRQAPLSINEVANIAVKLYPNPVQDNLIIDATLPLDSARIYDSAGKLVYENLSFDSANNQIDVSTFQSGIYFIRVTSGELSKTLKVMKQ